MELFRFGKDGGEESGGEFFLIGEFVGREKGVELAGEPAESGIYETVAGCGEFGSRQGGLGPCGFKDLTDGEVFGEEGVDFRTGVADSGLEVEEGDSWLSG